MTHASLKAIALCTALAAGFLGTVIASTGAEARGAKEYFSETYIVKQPLHGVEGRVGNYYCSYQRKPVHKIVNGKMKVVAWELMQHCY
ncbi:MAG: hypothetical protein NW216_03900 [Hyphomicrobium sp.]|nr:hypothetical protein [Hyphomicrobium sp.]